MAKSNSSSVAVSFKVTASARTRVKLNAKLANEKSFTLVGAAFSAAEVAQLCEGQTELVRVRSRTVTEGSDSENRGGVRSSVSDVQNGQDLAMEVRSAAGGIGADTDKGNGNGNGNGKGKGKSKAEERASAPPATAPESNGVHTVA